MKTATATINIVQLTQPNRDGLYPIVIRAHWHGMVEKRTGVSVPKNVWNKRTCTIQPSYPNSQALNNQIHSIQSDEDIIAERSRMEL